jgi:putative oxidoreductase
MPRSTVSLPGAVLSLFRIVVGFLFACHGAATLLGMFGGGYGPPPATGDWPGWYAAVIELVGGGLVVVGLGTRLAAFICSGAMAYAYFTVHQKAGLYPIQNKGEAAAMFCWAFFLLVGVGPGFISVDALLGRLFRRRPAPSPAASRVPETASAR